MKKYLVLLILSIIIIPLCSVIPFHAEGGWYAHYLGIFFFGLLAIGFVLWNFDKFLSSFYIYCLLSTFFITRIEPRALILIINFGIFALASYGISRFPKHYKKYIFYTILGIVLIQLFWIALQINNRDPIFYYIQNPLRDSPVGSIGSPNQAGIFFALTLPAMLYVHPLLGIFCLIGLFISRTSFAFIAATISGLSYLFFIHKRIFVVALTSVLLAGSVFFIKVDKPRLVDFNTRFAVWNHAVHSTVKGQIEISRNGKKLVGKTNPLHGYGFGRFLAIFPFVPCRDNFNYADEKFTHAHNDYIELFFELGWIGLILLLLLIGNFIRSFIRAKKTKESVALFCGLLSYVLCSMGNFLMQMAIPGMLLILYYGLYKGGLRIDGKTTVSS